MVAIECWGGRRGETGTGLAGPYVPRGGLGLLPRERWVLWRVVDRGTESDSGAHRRPLVAICRRTAVGGKCRGDCASPGRRDDGGWTQVVLMEGVRSGQI